MRSVTMQVSLTLRSPARFDRACNYYRHSTVWPEVLERCSLKMCRDVYWDFLVADTRVDGVVDQLVNEIRRTAPYRYRRRRLPRST